MSGKNLQTNQQELDTSQPARGTARPPVSISFIGKNKGHRATGGRSQYLDRGNPWPLRLRMRQIAKNCHLPSGTPSLCGQDARGPLRSGTVEQTMGERE